MVNLLNAGFTALSLVVFAASVAGAADGGEMEMPMGSNMTMSASSNSTSASSNSTSMSGMYATKEEALAAGAKADCPCAHKMGSEWMYGTPQCMMW